MAGDNQYQFRRIFYDVANGALRFQQPISEIIQNKDLREMCIHLDNTIVGGIIEEHDVNLTEFNEADRG